MRLTVTITTTEHPEPRDFHLSPERAERFAAKVREEGGAATIGPFNPSCELLANLQRAGVA